MIVERCREVLVAIRDNMNSLPYGMRYICKQLLQYLFYYILWFVF